MTRDSILTLLSEEEVAGVSAAEAAARISKGDEYLDLERLELGVRLAFVNDIPAGQVLARKAVLGKTWSKILVELATHPAAGH